MKSISLLLLFAAALGACSSAAKRESTINISGAFALYPLVVKWAEVYEQENPGVRFNISGGGAGKGMADALSGTVDLGMFSREISQAEINQGAWWAGLCIDAVVPTINANNKSLEIIKKQGLTKEQFADIFINSKYRTWGEVLGTDDQTVIEVLTRSDACGAAETWAQYLGGKQESLMGTGIFGDPGLAEAVTRSAGAIGFNNTIFAYDPTTGKKRPGIEIAPIDINGNGQIDPEEDFYGYFSSILDAIGQGKYPSPPARELYFVSKGKPEKEAAINFIKWALTDGQKYVTEAGYVPIPQDKIDSYLNKLDTE
jgi:phosphate transport system substrate-binding protein